MARRGPKGPVGAHKVENPKGVPSCPAMLDGAAQIEWRRVLPELIRMHGIGCVDRGVLTIYCKAWSDVQRMEAFLKKNGETYESNTGNPRIRPEVEIMNKAAGRLMQSAAALGMTPVSRKGLLNNAGEKQDDNEKWLLSRTKGGAKG